MQVFLLCGLCLEANLRALKRRQQQQSPSRTYSVGSIVRVFGYLPRERKASIERRGVEVQQTVGHRFCKLGKTKDLPIEPQMGSSVVL